MKRQTSYFLAVFFLCALLQSIYAQTPSTPPAKATPSSETASADKNTDKNKGASKDEARLIAEQRRATSIALLISLADEARSYRNQTLRARVQARAADILWVTDVEKARTLFRRAWEAAEIADAENQRRHDDERRAEEQAGRPWSGSLPPSLRTEVLRMVAKRDRLLGEEFLGKLDESRKQQATNASTEQSRPSNDADPFELPSALRLRLRLAQQLLETDVARAMEFADPALLRVSVDGLVFLCYLRAKNAAAADERYQAMLMRAGADIASDANTISLLSSYIFTPFLFVRFAPDGGTNSSQYNNETSPPEISTELRAAFLRVAEQVFLRPLAPPEQDRTTSGRTGKYLVMMRLLPYFEQFAPEQTTVLMRAQITALAREVPENYKRQAERAGVRNGVDESGGDSIESILDQVERATKQEDRDNLWAQAALMAVEKSDPRAFDFADKIENSEMRKSVRAYVDFSATKKALEKKRMDDALTLARKGALTSMQRIWAITEVATSLIKTDRDAAIDLLDEAAAEARRIGGSSADRPRALVAVATIFFELDRQKAWDLISEVVRAANNTVEEFSGEDTRIIASLHTSAQTSVYTFTADHFDLSGIFRSLANDNFERSIVLAKDFNGEAPRATALTSIARTTLEKKPDTKAKK